MIGGFIITGTELKKVLLRAIGPSLRQSGLTDAMRDPVLELYGPDGKLLRVNDNWRDDPAQAAKVQASGIPPRDGLESAIAATLPAGNYTAVVSGTHSTAGTALVEVYDLAPAARSRLANISTRGLVENANGLIGGFILGGGSGSKVLIRALGPSLAEFGIEGVLNDPKIALHDAQGTLIGANDNWRSQNPADISATGVPPDNAAEAAILTELPAGAYTAVVTGAKYGTGVALVEVYTLP